MSNTAVNSFLTTAVLTASMAAPLAVHAQTMHATQFHPTVMPPTAPQYTRSAPVPNCDLHLSQAEWNSAIQELRAKHLLLPIAGINPESFKGSYYSKRGTEMHEASDILCARMTPIHATEDGTIARLFLSRAGGNTIYELDPSGHWIYYYAHLQQYAPGLTQGEHVSKGQVIGFVGTSGNAPANCPHLHFSISKVRRAGNWWQTAPIDPYEVFRS